MCQTQKAAGVRALQDSQYSTGTWFTAHDLEEAKALLTGDLPDVEDTEGKPKPHPRKGKTFVKPFARPAPLLPCPGFVASREVVTAEDVEAVWHEMRAADPHGELIIAERIDAEFSACWSQRVVSVGAGHDGATAGRDSFEFPVMAPVNDTKLAEAIADSGIPEHPDPKQRFPHIEIVWAKGNPPKATLVQLRAGPEAAGLGDFIPNDVTVKAVHKAPLDDGNDEFLKWEKEVDEMAKVPGSVAWAPGATQGCHAALHCMAKGVPITFAKEKPKVGSVLARTDGANAEPDVSECIAGLALTWSMKMDRPKATELLKTAAVAIHGYQPGNAFWLGVAAGVLHKAATACVLGELRHWGKWDTNGKTLVEGQAMSRDQVYAKAFADPGPARERILLAYNAFMTGKWSTSYGGAKWGNCARELARLDAGMIKLCKTQNVGAVGDLLAGANGLLNALHNGGPLFNKFLSASTLDSMAKGQLMATLDAIPGAWRAWGAKVSKAKIGKVVQEWAAWSPLTEVIAYEQVPLGVSFFHVRNLDGTNVRFQWATSETGNHEHAMSVPSLAKALAKLGPGTSKSFCSNAMYHPIPMGAKATLPMKAEWLGHIITISSDGETVSAEKA